MVEWVTRPALPELTAEFCRRMEDRLQQASGEMAVALTGGRSAGPFYDAWAARGVDSRLRFYWSDERVVPPTDPDSNYKLAHDRLLRPGKVPEDHVHAPLTSLPPAECAAAYAAEIRQRIVSGTQGTPVFPLIILGMGADGHTGSLFPGRDPYEDQDLLVRAVAETGAHPHPRITFTPRLLNAATHVWFLITGAAKAWAVEQLAQRTASVIQIPALVVDPQAVRITIFADEGSTGGRRLD
jgi:6-phosphogluconolactonase